MNEPVEAKESAVSGAGSAPPDAVSLALGELARAWPDRIDATPEDIEAGLARLVLTIVEFLRQVLEHQAVRRMEGGSLSDDEIERLGLALLRLQERLEEIKSVFGLSDEELNIDLGPLGRLI
jgi:hypothetical protein